MKKKVKRKTWIFEYLPLTWYHIPCQILYASYSTKQQWGNFLLSIAGQKQKLWEGICIHLIYKNKSAVLGTRRNWKSPHLWRCEGTSRGSATHGALTLGVVAGPTREARPAGWVGLGLDPTRPDPQNPDPQFRPAGQKLLTCKSENFEVVII